MNSGAFRLKVAAAKMFGLISTGQAGISLAPPVEGERSKNDSKGGGSDGTGGGNLHPFVRGLVETLPDAGQPWSEEGRKEWLDAAAAIFKLIYKDAATSRASTAQQQPSERSQNGAQD